LVVLLRFKILQNDPRLLPEGQLMTIFWGNSGAGDAGTLPALLFGNYLVLLSIWLKGLKIGKRLSAVGCRLSAVGCRRKISLPKIEFILHFFHLPYSILH